MTLGEICSTKIEYVDCDETIRQAWKHMMETGFSQFPVRRGGNIVGSVSERGINRALLSEDSAVKGDLLVSSIMEEKFPQLSAKTPIASAVSLLQYVQALLIENDGLVSGIVANSDIGSL